MITLPKVSDTISKAIKRQQGMMNMHDKLSNTSATLAAFNNPVTDNIANMTPAFTTIVKMGDFSAPLPGNWHR